MMASLGGGYTALYFVSSAHIIRFLLRELKNKQRETGLLKLNQFKCSIH